MLLLNAWYQIASWNEFLVPSDHCLPIVTCCVMPPVDLTGDVTCISHWAIISLEQALLWVRDWSYPWKSKIAYRMVNSKYISQWRHFCAISFPDLQKVNFCSAKIFDWLLQMQIINLFLLFNKQCLHPRGIGLCHWYVLRPGWLAYLLFLSRKCVIF